MKPVDIVVIGAGISGIGVAIRLRELGFDDFVVLEKAASIGGTWRDNTYPGCACDVPSALYSYSFAQKDHWSRVFAAQPEILAYVDETASRFGVLDTIRFEEPVEEASWSEAAGRWHVRTPRERYAARIVISCTGYLHEPLLPDIPGLADFLGTVFHSSRWNHDHDLTGERVAVVGTGASAIQFVPQIQPKVSRLHVFQRTPQWIFPKPDAALNVEWRRVLELPAAREAFRAGLHHTFEAFGLGFRNPALLERFEWLAKAHLSRSVKDRALREKLTPDYTLGCKRVLLSNDYYPSLTRSNVEVHATGVAEVRGRTLVGRDGTEREVDTIILGTGFRVSEQPIAERIRGRDGRTLASVWAGSPEAHRGTAITGFPNTFIVVGPNLAIGHNSAFIVIEAQIAYIMSALATMRSESLARVEVRREAQDAYNAKLQRDLAGTVWSTGGCTSYYIDANGKNSIGFPWSTNEMRRLLSSFDCESYHLTSIEAPEAKGRTAGRHV